MHALVKDENMIDKKVEENITSIISAIEKKLPMGTKNIRNVGIKLTMGKISKSSVVGR